MVVAPSRVRNIVLVGDRCAGKTALVDSLLAATGALRAQRPEQAGLDWVPIEYNGIRINLFEPASRPDLADQLRVALNGADAALFVIAADEPISGRCLALWEECADAGLPRALVVSKLDAPHLSAEDLDTDFDDILDSCREAFGESALPLYLPLHAEDGGMAGLIGLLSQRIVDYSGEARVEREADPEHLPLIHEHSRALVEAILAESDDDTVMDRYLDGEIVAAKVLIDGLDDAVARGLLHPVLATAARSGVGTAELLELMTSGFPSPLQQPPPVTSGPHGSPRDPLTCDPSGPLAALVLGTDQATYDGRRIVRVFSGTLRPGMTVQVSGAGHPDGGEPASVGALRSAAGPQPASMTECTAGDVCAVTGLDHAHIGDTVSGAEFPLRIDVWASSTGAER